MEDPAARSEIKGSSTGRNGGKVSWILNKGLALGKKMVVTALVVSSAPLILPPVMVISAIGVIFSVPYGIFLASHACTEKLMSKLLPSPAILEYGATFDDGEKVGADENQGETGRFNGNSFVQKEEGEEFRDDVNEEIGMRIGLNSEELDEGNILEDSHGQDSPGKDIKELSKMVYATVEENRNEEEEKPSTDIEVKIERITNGKELKQMIEESGSEKPEEKDEGDDIDKNGQREEDKLERYSDREKEYGKLREDSMEEVEMRIELVDEGKREFAENDLENAYGKGGLQKDDNKSVKIIDSMKKKDDEEDKGQFFEEVKELSKDIELKVEVTTEWIEKEPETGERIGEEPADLNEISGDMAFSEGAGESTNNIKEKRPVEANNLTVQVDRDMDVEEDKELVRETKGLLEKIRDEGEKDYSVEDKQNVEMVLAGAEDDVKVPRNLRERGPEFEKECVLGNVEMKRPTSDFEQKVENNNDEQTPDISKELQEMGAGNMDLVPKEMKLREGIGGSKKKDVKNILKTTDQVEGVGKTISDGRGAKDGEEPLMDSGIAAQGTGFIAINAQEDSQLNREKGTKISSDEDMRETTQEGGVDLWEHKKAISQSDSYLGNDNYDGGQQTPGHHQRSDFVDHTRVSPKDDLGTAFNKVFYDEQKIWEKMNSIRKIVGYKGTPEETCTEELKALYLFTGIEPPSSLNNHSDLVEVNKMLHLLMSILGVK